MASKYNYLDNDYMYDVETLKNIFTMVFFNPKRNIAIASYKDDSGLMRQDPENTKAFIEQRIYDLNKNFNGQIFWEDLDYLGTGNNENLNYDEPTMLGYRTFAKRLGLACSKTALNANIVDRDTGRYPEAYYPVKDTDPDYDPVKHGIFFGYNSTSYDTTMLAAILSDTDVNVLVNGRPEDRSLISSAQVIRDYNDSLFSPKFKKNMPSRLAYSDDTSDYAQPNYKLRSWTLRKSWLYTNRYIDVARLNEKQQRVALKRLLGMIGQQILESDKLSHDTEIKTLDELADLFAYNVSDVVNMPALFEHTVYQTAFNLKRELLTQFPEAVYERDKTPGTYRADNEGPNAYMRIRRDRLTSDSTSAKFVEFVIAPYNKLKDIPTVSFMYPHPTSAKRLTRQYAAERITNERVAALLSVELNESISHDDKRVAKRLKSDESLIVPTDSPLVDQRLAVDDSFTVVPSDILEDSKKWFEDNVALPGTSAHDDFMNIYNFYDGIRGKNVNASEHYQTLYGEYNGLADRNYIGRLMAKYNTNLFYFDKNGDRTTCLANFSIGGIHGAEVKMEKYKKDLEIYERMLKDYEFMQTTYGGPDKDPLVAINGDATVENIDGEPVKIRQYLKSGSTRKQATWRELEEPTMFKQKMKDGEPGSYEIQKQYTYVSTGKANHEDFTSYYPLLIVMLFIFANPERGESADPYYEIFERRFAMKKRANDPSVDDQARHMANLIQELMKLLLNAASGAGDATFDNNIRVNNGIVSMRIIGQLFAWRIGQAQSLAGARVPSTNTDGLYTMDITPELNDEILFDVAADMHIGIEPEVLDRFVTKDSNNRLEYVQEYSTYDKATGVKENHTDGKITSAKGGTLNSWGGPWPTQSLDHPSAIDNALAYYLSKHPDPANTMFDEDLAKQQFANIFTDNVGKPQEIIRAFQWIMASSPGSHSYAFLQKRNKITGEILENIPLQHYNRILLTKPKDNIICEPFNARHAKVNPNTYRKRVKNNELPIVHDDIAAEILLSNGYDIRNEPEDPRHEAKIQKVKSMPADQHIDIINENINMMSDKDAYDLLSRLDADAYLGILRRTFENSWSNLEPSEIKRQLAESI